MRFLQALALPTALAVLPAVASAQVISYQPKAPVEVLSADVQYISQVFGEAFLPQQLNIANGIAIRFVNRNLVVATEVRFTVKYHGQTVQINDRGSFAPDTEIAHAYNLSNLPNNVSDALHVDVSMVRYADGSSWETGTLQGRN